MIAAEKLAKAELRRARQHLAEVEADGTAKEVAAARGQLELPSWRSGDHIPMGADLTLVVVEVQPAENEGEPGFLIVAEA